MHGSVRTWGRDSPALLDCIPSFEIGSEPVISFFNEGKSIFGVCLFCIFVTNTIYVISTN